MKRWLVIIWVGIFIFFGSLGMKVEAGRMNDMALKGPVKVMVAYSGSVSAEYHFSKSGLMIMERDTQSKMITRYDEKERVVFYGFDGGNYHKTIYNDQERTFEVWEYNAEKRTVLVSSGILNDRGQILENIAKVDGVETYYYKYSPEGKRQQKIEMYGWKKMIIYYDENERFISEEMFVNDEKVAEQKYFHDEEGKLIFFNNAKFNGKGEKYVDTKFTYQYSEFDSFGNPLKRSIYINENEYLGDNTRKITYYE